MGDVYTCVCGCSAHVSVPVCSWGLFPVVCLIMRELFNVVLPAEEGGGGMLLQWETHSCSCVWCLIDLGLGSVCMHGLDFHFLWLTVIIHLAGNFCFLRVLGSVSRKHLSIKYHLSSTVCFILKRGHTPMCFWNGWIERRNKVTFVFEEDFLFPRDLFWQDSVYCWPVTLYLYPHDGRLLWQASLSQNN